MQTLSDFLDDTKTEKIIFDYKNYDLVLYAVAKSFLRFLMDTFVFPEKKIRSCFQNENHVQTDEVDWSLKQTSIVCLKAAFFSDVCFLSSVRLSDIYLYCWLWWVSVLPPNAMQWVGDRRSNCVPRADNPFTLSWKLHRVSSFIFVTPNVSLFTDAFSREALIPVYSLRSECADTLVTSRSEDAFIGLIANSILGAIMLSIAANIAFCILSSTVSTILFISLSILSLKHLSKVFTLIAFPLTVELS